MVSCLSSVLTTAGETPLGLGAVMVDIAPLQMARASDGVEGGTAVEDAVVVDDTAETHFETDRESYRVRRLEVDSGGSLSLRLGPGGGSCVRLTPRTR